MTHRALLLALGLLAMAPQTAQAETAAVAPGATTVVAARPLKARTVLGRDDVAVVPGTVAGALANPEDAVGLETKAWVQAGKPIMADDVTPAAVVERNQLVTMRFRKGSLEITTDGRAMERAALGDPLRVMNLSSRSIVTARAVGTGVVEVR